MMGRVRLSRLVTTTAVVLCLAAPAGSADMRPTFEHVVERLNATNPMLKTLVVEQTGLIHWFGIFHFLIRTTVYAARPALYKVVVIEAPAILKPLGETFFVGSSPEQVLTNYTPTSIHQRSDGMLVVELVATRPEVNPPGGTVIIDVTRWLVQELTLHYRWGRLKVQYRYSDVDGFLLPDLVMVSLSSSPITAELTYTHYRLNIPIDPAVFGQPPAPPAADAR